MGVVNVTPDSFSDGGRYFGREPAVEHALRLAADGADVLDVGGESTRPGAEPVSVTEELDRVVPVIAALAERTAVPLSVDTTKAQVAEAALSAGATIVNDVSAGRLDPDMLATVAAAGAGFVAMHMRGDPRTMQDAPVYDDVVDEVMAFLDARLTAAAAAGIARGRLVADPGVGFGKTVEHNLALLGGIDRLVAGLRVPLMVGTSRKSFLGRILGGAAVADREEATLATVVWALDAGATWVRVHDVASAARTVRLLDVMRRATPEGVAA